MGLAGIAEILKQRYGEQHAKAWLRRQRQQQPPLYQQAATPPPRRPKASTPPPTPVEAPLAPSEATERLTACLEGELHPTALRVYRALHRVALEVASARGYSPKVTRVTYHLPTELAAHQLGMSRTTLWAHLKTLKQLGLVDQRGHTTTHQGRSVKDGSLWSVKLHPKRGQRARLAYEDLKHQWRDLTEDIERGRTAYNWIKRTEQSNPQRQGRPDLRPLVNWALTPGRLETPSNMTVQPAAAVGPEALLDVPHAPRSERNHMVDAAARAIAAHLGDPSLDFYRHLTWQLLRRHDQGQDYFHAVYQMILRAGADRREGFAKRPGALLVKRLKDAGLWEWLREAPPLRVGEVPPLPMGDAVAA